MQRKLSIIVCPVTVCADMLTWKVYIHRSECDLPPMVWNLSMSVPSLAYLCCLPLVLYILQISIWACYDQKISRGHSLLLLGSILH